MTDVELLEVARKYKHLLILLRDGELVQAINRHMSKLNYDSSPSEIMAVELLCCLFGYITGDTNIPMLSEIRNRTEIDNRKRRTI